MRLVEPLDLEGDFWLSDYFEQGQENKGHLQINTCGIPILTLYDWRNRNHNPWALDRVWGRVYGHPHLTVMLDGCVNETPNESQVSLKLKTRLIAREAYRFFGRVNINDNRAEPKFAKLICQIEGLTEWAGTGFCHSPQIDNDDSTATIRWKKPPDVSFPLPEDNVKVLLSTGFSLPQARALQAIQEESWFTMHFPVPQPLDKLKRHIHILRDFLVLGTGDSVSVTSIVFAQPDADWIVEIRDPPKINRCTLKRTCLWDISTHWTGQA